MPLSHTRVWCGVFAQKGEFCGAGTVEIAAKLADLQFNKRAKAVANVLEDDVGSSIRFYTRPHVCEKGNRRRKEQ